MFRATATRSDPLPLVLLGATVGFALGLQSRQRARHRVRGKVVLVTGGSRGLGLELARQLGERGAQVVIIARDRDELQQAESELEERGIRVLALPCDVTDPEEVEAVVGEIRWRLGPVDVLVNNAGRIEVGPAEHMTEQDFRAAMNVHFWAPLYTTDAVLPDMRRRRRGHIVNIASIGGAVPVPHMLPYTASKHALVGLSRGWAVELPRHGVSVTTVLPGPIRTGGARHAHYKGRQRLEYAWFLAADSVPGFSASVRHAARRIRRGIERGEREVVIGAPAHLALVTEALAPALLERVLEAVGRWLPSPGGRGAEARTGDQIGLFSELRA